MSNIRWSEAEKNAWKPPEDLSVSEWADKYRILDNLSSAESGAWSTSRTPYLKGVMDAFSDPHVEQITMCSSTQVGKTETLLNCMAYSVDQDPGPILMVMPREEDALYMSTKRVKPMLKASKRLSKHLTDKKTDNRNKEIKFAGSVLYFAGANSPADLASRPVRYLFCDEIDKYPSFAGSSRARQEADPVSLAIERTRTYYDRKIVLCSTPTDREGYIWREFEKSDKCLFHVPCPKCLKFQTLEFRNVKWPEEIRDPAIIREKKLAYYQCIHCEHEILDSDKNRMLKLGVWVPEGSQIDASGNFDNPIVRHKGFRINALYSPWLTYSEIAAKFLGAKNHVNLLLNFVNSYLAYIWEDVAEKVSAEKLASKADSYEEATVPNEAVVLTAGVDVQKDCFYYVIRAWGYGEKSWLVKAGKIETVEALCNYLFKNTFESVDGRKKHRIRLTFMDSGYRTDEVYTICREWLDLCRPIKGQQRISGVPIKAVKIYRDFAGNASKHSLRLWHLDVSHYKDKIVRLQNAAEGEPGAWRLHRNPKDDYLRQITAEHKILKRDKKTGLSKSLWVPRPGGGENHWGDCEVYATAAADQLGVYALQKEDAIIEASTANTNPSVSEKQYELGKSKKEDWITGGKKRQGWV